MPNILNDLRQLQYPKEFRIAPLDLVSTLERLAGTLAALSTVPQTQPSDLAQAHLLAEVGTGLWRARQKMLEPGTNRPKEEMRRAYRHLESVWDALTQAGMEIIDPIDSLFDPGMSLKAIAFQPTPGIQREKVIETIKPVIYYKGEPIQMGEVIVGIPESSL